MSNEEKGRLLFLCDRAIGDLETGDLRELQQTLSEIQESISEVEEE